MAPTALAAAVEEAEKVLPKATTEAATAAAEDEDRRAAVGRTSPPVPLATPAALVTEEPLPSEIENTGTSSDVGAGDGAPCDENASAVVVYDR